MATTVETISHEGNIDAVDKPVSDIMFNSCHCSRPCDDRWLRLTTINGKLMFIIFLWAARIVTL